MERDELQGLPVAELLRLTQSNVTQDPAEGLVMAELAYERAETPVDKGAAARQAGFRAEQADADPAAVQQWFDNSRVALASDEPALRRELIATELLNGRASALRRVRTGSSAIEAATLADSASAAFERGENILQEQHVPRGRWDRFGTMLARHRATHEAMSGRAGFAAVTAVRGLWRAVRAEREGTPEDHRSFVAKQLAVNAIAGALALSTPLAKVPKIAAVRQQAARWLLG